MFVGKNLGNNFEEWKRLATETENINHVLRWISDGVQIPFNSVPLEFELENRQFSLKEHSFIVQELKNLVKAGCIVQCKEKPRCVSPISTVPKKDSFRLITDLRRVNSFCDARSFIYEDIKTVIDLAQPSDNIVTCDIKNGFFHIKVHPEHSQYLGFKYQSKYYKWVVLPFGLSVSPFYFSKTIRAVVQWLRTQNLRISCYVDDFILFDSPSNINKSCSILISTLKRLGFIINYDKSQFTPSTERTYIGYVINTAKKEDSIWVSIPKERIKRLKHDIARMLKHKYASARSLARIAGQCISMSKAIIPAKLLLRNLYRLLASRSSWQDVLNFDDSTIKDLQWWYHAVSSWNGKAYCLKTRDPVQIATDASGEAWGGLIVGSHYEAQGAWDHYLSSKSSNYREITAVLMTLISFLPIIKGKSIQILSDNISTVAYINFMGGVSQELTKVATSIWSLAIRNSIDIQAKYLPGYMNRRADALSRIPAKYEWVLHPRVFSYLDSIHGPFTIDRFASAMTAQCQVYNSLFLDPYTSGVDALSQTDWRAHNNFVNAPFRLLNKVINTIRAQKAQATIIAPWWPAQTWFQKLKRIATCSPIRLPKAKTICFPLLTHIPEPVKNPRWKMYAWRVNGNLD